MIDPKLVEILGCPVCDDRPPLREVGAYLVCERAGHGFPVLDGVPHLVPEACLEPSKMEAPPNGR